MVPRWPIAFWLLIAFVVAGPAAAKQISVRGEGGCSYKGTLDGGTIEVSDASPEVDAAVADIVRASGLEKNFVVCATTAVGNAAAVLSEDGHTRFLLYNPEFFSGVKGERERKLTLLGVFAHEIGHHLQGHTLLAGGSQRDRELEADSFAAFAMCRLHYDIEDSRYALETLLPDVGSKTHPSLLERCMVSAKARCRAMADEPGMSASSRAELEKLAAETGERIAGVRRGEELLSDAYAASSIGFKLMRIKGYSWPESTPENIETRERNGETSYFVVVRNTAGETLDFKLCAFGNPVLVVDPFGYVWQKNGSKWERRSFVTPRRPNVR
jgi:hypothetical protein